MTTYRHAQEVVHKPTGSHGITQFKTTTGTNGIEVVWRVWFDAKNWKGDPAMIHEDRLVKMNVPESDLEPA